MTTLYDACALHAGQPRQEYRHALKFVLLTAFPLQKWLGQRVSVVRYTYIVCPVLVSTLTTAHFILSYKRWFNGQTKQLF